MNVAKYMNIMRKGTETSLIDLENIINRALEVAVEKRTGNKRRR